jgi:[acyl-carrier-protein] S-malonyltransferase
MGRDFLEKYPAASEIVRVGQDITGLQLPALCLNGPLEELTRTLVCQPAVFGVSLMCWEVLKRQMPVPPAAVAGHSLGEYTALAASGVFSLRDGFALVKRRAEIMEEISSRLNGGMLAILGHSIAEVRQLLVEFPRLEISNINTPQQTVVAGSQEELDKFSAFLQNQRVKARRLKVSGPFHTSLMEPGVSGLAEALGRAAAADPVCPVYANHSARKVETGTAAKEALLCQMVRPVRWVECVENMVRDGVEVFVEVGPGTVLKGLVGKIVPEIPVLNVENSQTLEEALEFLRRN